VPDVSLEELKIGIRVQFLDRSVPEEKAVENPDRVSPGEELSDEMGTHISRSPRDEDSLFLHVYHLKKC
jgi:hypothetical protein